MPKTARETQPFQRGPDGRGDRAGRTDSTDARIPREEEILLHGHRVSYRTAGRGPLVVLIHGITGNSQQWDEVMPLLAERYSVVAPDLLGHGRSAKPRGDYSLGAYAVGIRDLLIALGHRRATVVGHSLGGGIAMQFSYEYPVFCERLVLVSSGGLGRRVHPLLQAATLPGAEVVLPLITSPPVIAAASAVAKRLGRLGLQLGPDLAEMGRGYASLADTGARQAFLHSLRAVIEPGGQRVSARDRLYLAEMVPSLVVWGGADPLIPVEHAAIAQREMPGSRLEIFEDAGHFPFLEEPERFAEVLGRFLDSTEPSRIEFSDEYLEALRTLMAEHAGQSERDS
jgi:pimeloyl-ACP methyl ester carboxylesterase